MKFTHLFLKNNFVIKQYRSKLRNIIRGHARLKKEGQISKIADLKRSLALSRLNIKDSYFSKFIMGEHFNNDLMELSIRQYLLLRVGAHDLNKSLLAYKGNQNKKIIYPLPKDWIDSIEKNGFKVAKKRSSIIWHCYLILLTGYGFLILMRTIYGSILTTLKRSKLDDSYIYFSNLNNGNIPNNETKLKSYDILNWYIKYSKKNIRFRTIKHDVKGTHPSKIEDIKITQSYNGPIPYLKGWKKIISFFFWGISTTFIALFDLMRGRWWHCFIFNQVVLAKQVELSNPEHLAKEYLFHNTNQTYRPIWTHNAEKLGSKIILYFYSTNVENFNIDPTYAWRCMSWPKYLVWDQHQAKFLERSLGNPQNVEIVNSVWFSDNTNIEISHKGNKNIISIFGVTPHRQVHYCTYSEELDYVIPDICKAFIKDILDCANIFDFDCLLKAKRDVGHEFVHPEYRHFLNSSQDNPNLFFIDPRISANRLINSSSIVISFPFTATAIIAKELGKPSCYYDPSNMIKQNHHGSHEIPVIGNKEALYEWIKINC